MRVSLLQLDLDFACRLCSVYYELADVTLTYISRALGAQAHKGLQALTDGLVQSCSAHYGSNQEAHRKVWAQGHNSAGCTPALK